MFDGNEGLILIGTIGAAILLTEVICWVRSKIRTFQFASRIKPGKRKGGQEGQSMGKQGKGAHRANMGHGCGRKGK